MLPLLPQRRKKGRRKENSNSSSKHITRIIFSDEYPEDYNDEADYDGGSEGSADYDYDYSYEDYQGSGGDYGDEDGEAGSEDENEVLYVPEMISRPLTLVLSAGESVAKLPCDARVSI